MCRRARGVGAVPAPAQSLRLPGQVARMRGVLVVLALVTLVFAGCTDQGGQDGVIGDSDGDDIPDLKEVDLGTDPSNADSDGDGIPDGVEALAGSNPLDTAVRTISSLVPATFARH